MARKKKLHRLQYAYIDYIQDTYACRPGHGRLYQPDKHAAAIHRLGLNYDLYVELACELFQDWADSHGWKYPYWTAIMSDLAMKRISALVGLSDATELDDNYTIKFQNELAYADSYIAWYNGNVAIKPKVYSVGNSDLRNDVAQYLCDMYGIEYLSTNYNFIACMIGEQDDYR